MLNIQLRASRTLGAILVIAHGTAIAAILLAGMPGWIASIAVAALVASLGREVWRNALKRSAGAVAAIEIASDNVLSIQMRRGDWVECEVRGDTYVLSFLTVLNLRRIDNGRGISVVILPDAIDAEDFRRLRVWLRWKEDGKTSISK